MSSYWGVCNGCLLSFLVSVCVGFGSNLVKQESTLAKSQVNKEAMPAAGYAYAFVITKTSVQSALVINCWQDQAAVNTIDALRSVGVIQAANSPTNGDVFTIRGFQTSNILRNGLKDYTGGAVSGQSQLANIERLIVGLIGCGFSTC